MSEQAPFEYRNIYAMEWSEDETRLAIATADYTPPDKLDNFQITVYDMVSDQVLYTIPASWGDNNFNNLAWFERHINLTSLTASGILKRYDGNTGTLINQWDAEGYVHSSALNVSVNLAALNIARGVLEPSNEQPIEIREIQTGDLIQSISLSFLDDNQYVDWMGWNTDGSRLALLARDGRGFVYKWDRNSLVPEYEFAYNYIPSTLTTADWCPNGIEIAITNIMAKAIDIYNVKTNTISQPLTQSDHIRQIKWNKESDLIAGLTGHSTVKIWERNTEKVIDEIRLSNQSGEQLAWGHNGALAIGRELPYDEWRQNPQQLGVTICQTRSLPTRYHFI